MAKQTSLITLKGKLGGMSFYQNRQKENLVKSIPVGFSERVKTEPAFENTRRNAAEFGWSAALAGRLIGIISQRWRYILKSSSVGQFTKYVYNVLKEHGMGAYGERRIWPEFKELVYHGYNKLIKNPMPSSVVRWQKKQIYENTATSSGYEWIIATPLRTTPELEEYYIQEGATHLCVGLYAVQIFPEDDILSNTGIKIVPIIEPIQYIKLDGKSAKQLIGVGSYNIYDFVKNYDSWSAYTSTCLMFFPAKISYEEEGETTEYAILQRLCSANMEQIAAKAPQDNAVLHIITNAYSDDYIQAHGEGWYSVGDTFDVYATDQNGNKLNVVMYGKMYYNGILADESIIEGSEYSETVEDWPEGLVITIEINMYYNMYLVNFRDRNYDSTAPRVVANKQAFKAQETAVVQLADGSNAYFLVERFDTDGNLVDVLQLYGSVVSFKVLGNVYCFYSPESLGTPITSLNINIPSGVVYDIPMYTPLVVGANLFSYSYYNDNIIYLDWTIVIDGVTTTHEGSYGGTITLGEENEITAEFVSNNIITIITQVTPIGGGVINAPATIHDGEEITAEITNIANGWSVKEWQTAIGGTSIIHDTQSTQISLPIIVRGDTPADIKCVLEGGSNAVEIELHSSDIPETLLTGAGVYIYGTTAYIEAPETYNNLNFVEWQTREGTLFADGPRMTYDAIEDLYLVAIYDNH